MFQHHKLVGGGIAREGAIEEPLLGGGRVGLALRDKTCLHNGYRDGVEVRHIVEILRLGIVEVDAKTYFRDEMMERHLYFTDVHSRTTDLRHHTWFALSRRKVIDLVEVSLSLEWFGGDIDKYDEMTICKLSGATEEEGTDAKGMNDFFKKIGWYTDFNFSEKEKFSWDDSDNPLLDFENFCVENIDNGVPITVDWSDWGGHWQVIIGIDTCKEDAPEDDVLILADPYDTSDQYQDGYYTYGAERFFYQWHEGEASVLDGPAQQPYLIAMPMDKAKELGLK